MKLGNKTETTLGAELGTRIDRTTKTYPMYHWGSSNEGKIASFASKKARQSWQAVCIDSIGVLLQNSKGTTIPTHCCQLDKMNHSFSAQTMNTTWDKIDGWNTWIKAWNRTLSQIMNTTLDKINGWNIWIKTFSNNSWPKTVRLERTR